MTSGRESTDDDGFSKSHHLSLTIGSGENGDEDYDDDKVFDMRSRMQSFAMAADDGGMPPTIFLDDADVVPTTSCTAFPGATTLAAVTDTLAAVAPPDNEVVMDHFVKNFFAADSCLFQPTGPGNFVEEVFAEKPPKFVGDYLFGGVIGEGSYSKVKEVMHIKTLMRRAVKIIKDKRLKKIPGGEQNVQHEIQVLQRIKHPNIVELFDIFRIEEKQKFYIVMEFCVCSLQQMLDHCVEKKLAEFQAQLYFTQIIDGLDYLHLQKIIHKDIKPGNLLLSLDGRLKICDFGVAEELDGSDEDWCITGQGTPKFQPPEVVSGSQKRFRGQLVDIWGSGVTLYNLVSGEYPFDGDVIMKLFESITMKPLEMPQYTVLSAELQQLLYGILEKDPHKRWNLEKIRNSEWFTAKLPVEIERIIRVPPVCDTAAHRPVGVYHALEQLYEVESERSEYSLNIKDASPIPPQLPFENSVAEHSQQEPVEFSEVEKGKHFNTTGDDACSPTPVLSGAPKPNNNRKKSQTQQQHPVEAAEQQQQQESHNTDGGSKLSKIFRRKNLTNFLQRLIF